MAELLANPQTTGRAQTRQGQDPGARGSLTIADSVVERIAAIAAGEVQGVMQAGSGLDKVLGQRYPRVSATISGHHARIQVDIAVSWPHPLGLVCSQVRDVVRDRVTQLAGVQVDAVDVNVAKVLHPLEPEQRRVQ